MIAQLPSVTLWMAFILSMACPQIAFSSDTNRDEAIAAATNPCVAIPANQVAWSNLSKTNPLLDGTLPNWAKVMSKTLPATTAAMLELDYGFRSVDREQLKLFSLARLAVSQTNHSNYGMAYAAFDLMRCDFAVSQTIHDVDEDRFSDLEKQVFQFARQMTIAARDVTNEQVYALKAKLGEERLVGLVLYIGYSNLIDRFTLSLNLPVESDGPLAPIDVHFVDSTPNGRNTKPAERVEKENAINLPSFVLAEQNWNELPIDTVRSKLDSQRNREARIRVPDWDEIKPKLPEGLYPRPLRIRWSRVVVGYQPKIGPAWIKCLRVFSVEAHQNQVFEESVFWVVTRGLQCFYCMGHCEMLMEVGGLSKNEIEDRTKRLASGDWSSFNAAEQAAFRFAYKLTYEPTSIRCGDYQTLVNALGEDRALDCLWWTCRCHLMTKISDGFQLQLEKENVFQD